MAEKNEDLLANFELRMKQLMFLCDSLREDNSELRAQLLQKTEEAHGFHSELKQLKSDYDSLKFAQTFVDGNGDEREKAKQRLSKLVQDVDKCISLLKG